MAKQTDKIKFGEHWMTRTQKFLYLIYDDGEKGPTIQKISRALTTGRVISLSFAPRMGKIASINSLLNT